MAWKFLSATQINLLLEQDVAGVQQHLELFLDLKQFKTSLKEAVLLDYYVSGFCWAKETNFAAVQIAGFMTLLNLLLENLGNHLVTLQLVRVVSFLAHSWAGAPHGRRHIFAQSLEGLEPATACLSALHPGPEVAFSHAPCSIHMERRHPCTARSGFLHPVGGTSFARSQFHEVLESQLVAQSLAWDRWQKLDAGAAAAAAAALGDWKKCLGATHPALSVGPAEWN
uniref:Uncharacterized protein n=1 Tax=Sphaerodactylus townsendi TaxID=933632 RepID=A0ACB8F7T2_9SAUR